MKLSTDNRALAMACVLTAVGLASAQDAAAEGFETYLIDDLTRAVDDASTAAVDEALGKAGVGLVYAKNLGRAS